MEKAARLFFGSGGKGLHSDCLHQLGMIEQRAGNYAQALKTLAELLSILRDLTSSQAHKQAVSAIAAA